VWCSPVRERVPALAPFAAVGGVLGLCCGLPVLFSLGVLGAVTGLSVSSRVLIGLGLVLGALGWARWVRCPGRAADLSRRPRRGTASRARRRQGGYGPCETAQTMAREQMGRLAAW